jgi:hypothetical protein
MLPLKSVRVEADASDQGAGGTGSSKLVLIHYGLDGNVKHYAQVAIVGPRMERKDLLLTRASCDWLGDAEPNDLFSLLLVSPPWPGWRCCVQKCSISVNEENAGVSLDELNAPVTPRNDEGNTVAFGNDTSFPGSIGSNKVYCGEIRRISGSEGHCGPSAGPQCASCTRFQESFGTS